MKTIHIIGSKKLWGAERFYLRLLHAIYERQHDTIAFLSRRCNFVQEIDKDISNMQLPMRTVWDPLSKWEISRSIDKIKPDVVQTYMGRATRLTHIPKNRGIIHISRLGNYYKLQGYRHAHAWIGNTKGICDYMIQNGFPAERVFHIYNFIDLPEHADDHRLAELRNSLKIPQHALVLATTGRFAKIKGHADLIDAFAKLPAEIQDRPIWLLMIGDGVLFDTLQVQANQLGINDRIIWTGWQAEPGLYYQLADVAIFPFLEQEPFGNVILEAWSYKTPVVTSQFRGATEFIRHEEDAWCVPCNDPKAIAEGITVLLNDNALRNSLVGTAYQKLKQVFGKNIIVGQYLNLYTKLLGQ